MVASTGLEIGNTIRKKMVHWDAPSIWADSMTASGIVVRKKVRAMVTLKLDTASGRISAQMVSVRFSTWVFMT